MIPTVNLNISIDKELELERQGLRRTRRFIGDANNLSDNSWYRAKMSRVPASGHDLGKSIQAAKTKPRQEARGSFLDRLFNQPSARRQPVTVDC